MPILPHVDEAYFKRITEALIEAVMKTSIDEKTKTAMVHTGEIVTACIQLIAMFAATSKGVDSPTKLRVFSEECAKRIRSGIKQVQDSKAKGGLDFMTTIHADDKKH